MTGRPLKLLLMLAVLLSVGAEMVRAQGARGEEKDKDALAKRGDAFVEAFHKGDARALAGFWTPDGDYTDQTGKVLKGRAAIEKAFKSLFSEHKGLKLHIESLSLDFVTPEVAVEDGINEVLTADGAPPSRARYTIVHVKKDGQWYLARVREAPYAPPGNYDHLRGLEWTIGDWAGEGENGQVERLSVSWADNQNFIHATFSTTIKNLVVGSANQWIGWDPIKKTIRSWIFDATGGFGESTIAQNGKTWTIKSNSVRQDGKKATATYVLTSVDADTFTLQAKDRTVDGEKLPDSKPIKMKRLK